MKQDFRYGFGVIVHRLQKQITNFRFAETQQVVGDVNVKNQSGLMLHGKVAVIESKIR